MHYDLSILFFLKKGKQDKAGKAPIYCRITVNGRRAELSTNEKVEVSKWDSGLQRLKGRTELIRVINNHLDIIVNRIKNQFNKFVEDKEEISASILKDFITGKKQKEHLLHPRLMRKPVKAEQHQEELELV